MTNINLGDQGDGDPSPSNILSAARKAVPAVDYALGVAGVAAAGAIIIGFLGNGRAAIIILSAMFFAMILLLAFARLVATKSIAIVRAGVALLWMVISFVGVFLFFTVTAVAIRQPLAWVQILGLDPSPVDMDKLLEVPTDYVNGRGKLAVELIRIQPRLADPTVFAKREAAMVGGGSYYSFVTRSHEFGRGSDIELEPGRLRTGFGGADYGFFMYVGQGLPDALTTFKREPPPSDLDTDRVDAWKLFWDYKPPTEMKKIRDEQKRFRGVSIAGVNVANAISVNKGGVYLLRSILINQSDTLVALCVVDTLPDGSVVIAWRTLKVFDPPIANGDE